VSLVTEKLRQRVRWAEAEAPWTDMAEVMVSAMV